MASTPRFGVVALVVAAGRGRRAGGGLPKQYRALAGSTVLRRSLKAMRGHPAVDAVLAVIHPDDSALYAQSAAGLDLLPPVVGGATRQQSVKAGLEAIAAQGGANLVLIHDAARCMVDAATIDRVLGALVTDDGAVPALPVVDSLRRGVERIEDSIDRSGLWRVQTPQGFRFTAILAAHRDADAQEATDDAEIARADGLAVALVEGSERNMKLTRANDFQLAEALLGQAMRTACGLGFDVHAFGPGDHVWLCGVRVPHSHALVGHSDADVGLHALTDAVLGALGEGDIGQHFPPSDPQWRGASSDRFLAFAAGRVAERGGRIDHVDVTLICEQPKVGPHRDAMRLRLSELLGISPERTNVKATTTERLGFTGRGEGIAAQAMATLTLPCEGDRP